MYSYWYGNLPAAFTHILARSNIHVPHTIISASRLLSRPPPSLIVHHQSLHFQSPFSFYNIHRNSWVILDMLYRRVHIPIPFHPIVSCSCSMLMLYADLPSPIPTPITSPSSYIPSISSHLHHLHHPFLLNLSQSEIMKTTYNSTAHVPHPAVPPAPQIASVPAHLAANSHPCWSSHSR